MTEISVRVVPQPGQEGELGGGILTEKLKGRIDELGQSIAGIATGLRTTLDAELKDNPASPWLLNEIQLNFSIDLEAESGVVIARARASAGFEVALTWSRERRKTTDLVT
jgi:hypothetical protein